MGYYRPRVAVVAALVEQTPAECLQLDLTALVVVGSPLLWVWYLELLWALLGLLWEPVRLQLAQQARLQLVRHSFSLPKPGAPS